MNSGTFILQKSLQHAIAADEATLSSALVTIFRGMFCNTILPGRTPIQFRSGEVIYNIGDLDRSMFFIQKGFVKVGTLVPDGREIIYDVRKTGDVVGELCVAKTPRPDRAVALEPAEAIHVSYSDIIATLGKHPDLLFKLMEIFCNCLADAYDQITSLRVHNLHGRVVQVLLDLAAKLGSANGDPVQIPAYLTQEEISQMVGARRERVSTTLNSLRRRGLVDYSSRGHLLLQTAALRGLVS
jgi:CRP-like cAMP-binding protein